MTSLQTSAPLERLPLNEGNEPVAQVALREHLVLDPPYQRGDVWGPRRRRLLIQSLLRGLPVGDVFLNVRDDDLMTTAVIDGKQRITTVRLFLDGHLSVPASWFRDTDIEATEATDDDLYVRYTGLTRIGQRRFERARFTTQRLQLATVDEEAEMFTLINFGGVPQGQIDPDAD